MRGRQELDCVFKTMDRKMAEWPLSPRPSVYAAQLDPLEAPPHQPAAPYK